VGAIIVAATFSKVRDVLVNLTDRYLFQKRYDYKELLKRFTDEVMVVLDLKRVAEMTVTTIADTAKLDGAALLLLNKDTRKYEAIAFRGGTQNVIIDEQEPIVTFLRETHEPIGQDGELGKVRFPEQVRNRVKELGARLALPLNVHEDLIGVLCLGKKKSDEEFTKDDVDILLPLARTLAIAVSNAQLVEELKVTQAQAAQKEKLAVIGTLSAGINHEICNPLGIVKAQCEAFLLDAEDGILIGRSQQELLERTQNIMRVALKQIDRATAITQKLSNFAKPIKEASMQPVPVEQEIDEVLLLVGHDLKLEKIEVAKDIQPGLPPIMVDRRQLQEVLFNLIRNAGQAIAPPGRITVRARADADRVRIEIADTGSGIPADKIEKIWDPFFTTKDPGKGTGLGLFIVRQIVERNKGRISLESVVGKGTTFFLDFPVAKAPSAAPAPAAAKRA
jgi:signal transduction histidine kinase